MDIFKRKKLELEPVKESLTPRPPVNGKAPTNGKVNGKAKAYWKLSTEQLRLTLERLESDTTEGLNKLTTQADAVKHSANEMRLVARTVRGK